MKIKSVQFQSAVGIPGTKISSELSIFPEKFPGVGMKLISEGLVLTINKVDKTSLTALVPLANIKFMVLDIED